MATYTALAAGAAVLAITLGIAAPAHAEQHKDAASVDLNEAAVVEVLEGVDDALLALPDDEAGLPSDQSKAPELPSGLDEPILVEGENGDIRVAPVLPANTGFEEVASDIMIADTGDESWTVPLAHQDGSLQIATVIESLNAPVEYEYELTLEPGAHVQIESGLVIIRNGSGEFVGGVAPAWAVDAAGADIATHYELRDNLLVQVVDHRLGGVADPVVADPWIGVNLFHGFSKTNVNGDVRYNFKRTAWGNAVHTGVAPGVVGGPIGGRSLMRSIGWDELRGTWGLAANKSTLFQQYDCHVTYAYTDVEWNLERFRSNKSDWNAWFNAFGHTCNWS